jgi:hypothetical protein
MPISWREFPSILLIDWGRARQTEQQEEVRDAGGSSQVVRL